MNRKLFWILAFLLAWFGRDGARGQQKQPVSSEQEDCGVTFNLTVASSGAQAAGTTTAGSTGTTAVIDNRQSACVYWKVAYSPNSATASVSVAFQTALDVAGVPTTWSNYPGTLDSGINPNTAITTGGARTEASGVEYPFLRMNMTILTGAGARIQGKLTGWKSRPPITATAVIVPGTICTAGAPCPVDGPTADGAAVAFPPVMIAGQDGANVQTMLTDTSGRPVVIGSKTNNAAAPGATNLGVLPCLANAAAPTWTEGFQVTCSSDLAGNQRVTGTVTTSDTATSTALADTLSNTEPLPTASAAAVNQRTFPTVFNGTTWDRMRGNTNGTIVQGAAATGAGPAGNPLYIGGLTSAGGLIAPIAVDGSGFIELSSLAVGLADATSNSIQLFNGPNGKVQDNNYPMRFNGVTWDREFGCTNQALFNLSGSGDTQIIAASGALTIRICHISFSTGTAEDVKVTRGTGANCVTGTADVTGLYKNVTAMALDFSPTAALRGAASGAICLNQSAVQALGGIVIYAQF